MRVYLEYLFSLVVTVLLVVYTSLSCLIKQFVSFHQRSKDIRDEIVVITGAGGGLGSLLAKKLAKLGAKMVLVDIDDEANKKTANEIALNGGLVKTFTCDLSNRQNIYKITDEIKRTVGDVDILINNAGIVTDKRFMDTKDYFIEKTFQVNTLALFWVFNI